MRKLPSFLFIFITVLLCSSCTDDTTDPVYTDTWDTRDRVAPVITMRGDDTVYIEYGDPESELDRYANVDDTSLIIASDPYPEGGIVSLRADKSGVNYYSPASSNEVFSIRYLAVDEAGNFTEAVRYVRIVHPTETDSGK